LAGGAARWAEAQLAAALVAMDPATIGGCVVVTRRGPVHDAWMVGLRDLLDDAAPVVPVPGSVTGDRLTGDIDISATLAAGRVVREAGVVDCASGGLLVVPAADQLEPAAQSVILDALDHRVGGERLAVIAFDEGDGEGGPSSALRDRLAFRIDLSGIAFAEASGFDIGWEEVAQARETVRDVVASEEIIEGLCQATLALGIRSARAERLALAVARALAALSGRDEVSEADATRAARMVLLARAEQIPEISDAPDEMESVEPETPEDGQSDAADLPPAEDQSPDDNAETAGRQRGLGEVIVEALAVDCDLANLVTLPPGGRGGSRHGGQEGGRRRGRRLGRAQGKPVGARRPRGARDGRLDIIATLRAAVPWQRLRRSGDFHVGEDAVAEARRIVVHRDDLRVARYREREAVTVIFVIDASGSTALARLAEAKGAVEVLLSESYRRRDEVALVSFRGTAADVLLAPTRSLVGAKRHLTRLPGGGATPLAEGLLAGLKVGLGVEHHGRRPLLVVMTDGRCNIDLSGTANRGQARHDALAAARRIGARGWQSLFLDVGRRPGREAEEIARALRGRYVFLPAPTSRGVADSVRRNLLSATAAT
jgi:magnesium chelatase subunit D